MELDPRRLYFGALPSSLERVCRLVTRRSPLVFLLVSCFVFVACDQGTTDAYETPSDFWDSLFSTADSVHFAGNYAEARDLRRAALSLARTRGDIAAEARALTGIGLSAWRLSWRRMRASASWPRGCSVVR